RDVSASPKPNLVLPITFYAVAGVSLALASFFWISGLGDRSDLESSCAPSHTCDSSSVDSAHAKLVVGDVLGGIGLVSAGVGTWFLLGKPGMHSSEAVGARFVPGGGVIDLHGRF